MKIGVDYYPEQWDKSLWERDAKQMAEIGVKVVRMAEFAWSRIEAVEGQYEFGWLDEALDLFAGRGMEIVLGTPTNCPPLWLYEKYPEAVQTGRDGRRIATGIRGHRCYSSPAFRKKAGELLDAMAGHYQGRKEIIAWQIDNELESNFCCCEYCSKAFRRWLQKKYHSLEEMNAVYGNVMWSGEYSSWTQVQPPLGNYQLAWYNPAYMLDFHCYASDSTVEYLEFQRQIIRKYFPQTPVTTNAWFCENMPDLHDLFHNLDFVSYDNYPAVSYSGDEEEYYSHAFHLDFMRGIKQAHFWIMEQLSGSMGSWAPMTETPRPGMLAAYSLQAFAHGADTVLHFRWRSAVRGAEMHWHGILDHSNVPGRRYREFAGLCERAKSLQKIAGGVTESKVAILYSAETEFAFKIQPQYQGFHYYNQLKAWHEAFVSMGLNVDIIDWRADISAYEVVVAPTLYLVDKEAVAQLYAFVEQGGHLVLTNRSGVKAADNSCIMEQLPTVYRELVGAAVSEYDAIGYKRQKIRMYTEDRYWQDNTLVAPRAEEDEGISDGTEYEIHGWCDILEPDTAKVLAVYADEFYAGEAAVTCNRYGKGKAYYVGVVGKKKFYHTVAEQILKDKVLPYVEGLPLNVEISYRKKDGDTYLFVFNNTRKEQEIHLPFGVDFGEEVVLPEQIIRLLPVEMKIGCIQRPSV